MLSSDIVRLDRQELVWLSMRKINMSISSPIILFILRDYK